MRFAAGLLLSCVCVAAVFVLSIFVRGDKAGRPPRDGTLIDTATLLAALAGDDLPFRQPD